MSIPDHEFRALAVEFKTKPNSYVFGMKIALWALLGVGGIEAAISSSWPLAIFGTLLTGVMFAHGVELQHQALHHTGFQSKKLNEAFGVLLGAPMLVSFAAYQASHLRHHRYLGTPENQEFFDYGDQYGRGNLSAVLHAVLRFSMLSHYGSFISGAIRSALGRPFKGETPLVSRRIRRDHLLMIAGLTAIGIASYLLHIPLLLRGWFFPLCLVAAPVHALIELPEHYRCDTESPNTFTNTRSIRSTPFLTWLTNGNNLHVEHHLLPGLPIESLPELHERIAPHIKHLYPTYVSFFAEVLFSRPRPPLPAPADVTLQPE